MGFSDPLSDGEVKFDLNLILVAQIQDLGTGRGDLTYLELRYLKSDRTIGCASSCNIKAARVISLRRNRRVLFLNLSILLFLFHDLFILDTNF